MEKLGLTIRIREGIHLVLGALLLIGLSRADLLAQNKCRTGIFLHHSTGLLIWGPNGSPTSIPAEIAKYNAAHSLTGTDQFVFADSVWPASVGDPDNEWYRWHNIFAGKDSLGNIGNFFQKYSIVVIKSCFPSSYMSGAGSAADTVKPKLKTTYNYKWHWRSFVKIMKQHPQNFFVIWTNAPLVASATTDQGAVLANQFCRWAKDTLARGLDAQFGAFPSNVYVLDYFHKVAGADGKLQPIYAVSSIDSHPNSTATALVAPQFVQEICNAARGYESTLSASGSPDFTPKGFSLAQCYPNPFNPRTIIRYELPHSSRVKLTIFNILGSDVRTLVDDFQNAGSHETPFDGSGLASGVYLYRLSATYTSSSGPGSFVETRKMVLAK